jgi:sugar lactone lactonase YvrE
LLDFVPLPCANVTKAAFGGEDLKTMYVTTAKLHLGPAEREAQPLAGGLFAIRVDTPGLPQHEIRHGV